MFWCPAYNQSINQSIVQDVLFTKLWNRYNLFIKNGRYLNQIVQNIIIYAQSTISSKNHFMTCCLKPFFFCLSGIYLAYVWVKM